LKKLIISMSLLVVIFSLVACGDDVPPKGDHNAKDPAPITMAESSAPPPAPAVAMTTSSDSEDASASGGSADRSIDVLMKDDGGNYVYDPVEITVSAGETIELVLASQNEFHSFTVDDLGIDVEVEAGETSELVFTFDEPGTYDFICLPHESLGMVGQIIVQ
jgi:plastocyanin